jgi:hypothetical protein
LGGKVVVASGTRLHATSQADIKPSFRGSMRLVPLRNTFAVPLPNVPISGGGLAFHWVLAGQLKVPVKLRIVLRNDTGEPIEAGPGLWAAEPEDLHTSTSSPTFNLKEVRAEGLSENAGLR